MDVADAEVFLISGYPSIEFSHVDGLIGPEQTLSSFFQQLSTRPRGPQGNAMVQQQMVLSNSRQADADAAPVVPADETVDVHYESIGRQTIAAGDALALDVGSGEATYQRIVEWTLPDLRNEHGYFVEDYRRQQDPEKYDDAAWDAVKFKNPLPFPMTTAPATFVQENRFLGQSLSAWVGKDDETTLRITKALSVRTSATETEDPNSKRIEVSVAGSSYRKITANGELVLTNTRKVDVLVVIKRRFSGDLLSADEKPEVTLREEGVWSVNRRNELKWNLTLKPGETKTLKYRFEVLSSR
jgi:hypothetical protein